MGRGIWHNFITKLQRIKEQEKIIQQELRESYWNVYLIIIITHI